MYILATVSIITGLVIITDKIAIITGNLTYSHKYETLLVILHRDTAINRVRYNPKFVMFATETLIETKTDAIMLNGARIGRIAAAKEKESVTNS